ncbi:hypothetical protein [Aminobacter sp. MSH1]|uniref:hypothetical protein n=1 Tax=Aminobacter sp. MSH1 TaxID=374606 RepID=UPI00131F290B|nr:hypothetical protein [Aminobacter sp. MSH1]
MRLSRAQLHELVWSKPMTEIARQFGVRNQHIARACDDADIARPPAGYWQKIGHGKVVPRQTLSNDRFAVGDMIAIEVSGWSIAQPELDVTPGSGLPSSHV